MFRKWSNKFDKFDDSEGPLWRENQLSNLFELLNEPLEGNSITNLNNFSIINLRLDLKVISYVDLIMI